MFYFKQLSFDASQVSKELASFLKIHASEFLTQPDKAWHNADLRMIAQWCPSLIPTFKQQGLNIRYVSFLISFTSKINIHTDDVQETYRINIPVMNTENTKTIFYKTKVESLKKIRPDGLASFEYDESECEEVCHVIVDRPVILNIKQPHAVHIYNNKFPRITATIAVFENLETMFP